MRHFLKLLCAMSLFSAAAQCAVITFDDLNGNPPTALPSNYQGLTWDSGWNVWTGGGNPDYNPHSPPNLAYFNSANDQGFTFPAAIIFDGAWFSGPSGISTVSFELFLGGVLEATSPSLAVAPTPQFLASDYAGPVDRVEIDLTGTVFNGLFDWTIDDITYSAANSVPEPSTLAYLCAAAAAALTVRPRSQATPLAVAQRKPVGQVPDLPSVDVFESVDARPPAAKFPEFIRYSLAFAIFAVGGRLAQASAYPWPSKAANLIGVHRR